MNLEDDEIIDYLMTSDFNEGHTEEEFRFLLLKFRSMYRVLRSKNEQINHSFGKFVDDFNDFKKLNDENITKLVFDNSTLQNTLEVELNRKLTIKERFTGRINRYKKEEE